MKRRSFQILSVLLALLLALTACSAPAARLTEEEIEVLRERYPLCGYPELVEVMYVPIEEIIERADTFVYGEIIGEAEPDHSAIWERFQYTLTVIEDSERLFEKGEQVTLISDVMLRSIIPEFKDGMRAVVAYTPETGNKNSALFMLWSVFYVTEDGYVLSSFDENKMGSELILSGMRVEDALAAVKKNK